MLEIINERISQVADDYHAVIPPEERDGPFLGIVLMAPLAAVFWAAWVMLP